MKKQTVHFEHFGSSSSSERNNHHHNQQQTPTDTWQHCIDRLRSPCTSHPFSSHHLLPRQFHSDATHQLIQSSTDTNTEEDFNFSSLMIDSLFVLFHDLDGQVSLKALQSIFNPHLFVRYRKQMEMWHVDECVLLLYRILCHHHHHGHNNNPNKEMDRDGNIMEYVYWKMINMIDELIEHEWMQKQDTALSLDVVHQLLNEEIPEEPNYDIPHLMTSFDYLKKAIYERFQFHPLTAKRFFDVAIQRSPWNYSCYFSTANIYLRLDNFFDYSRHLQLCLYYARVYVERYSNGHPLLNKYLPSLIRQARSYECVVRARLMIHHGELDGAIQEYERALGVDEGYMLAHFYLGFYHAFDCVEVNSKRAYEHFQRAMEVCDATKRPLYLALIYDNLGQVAENEDDLEKACGYYGKCLELNEGSGWGKQNYAQIITRIGKEGSIKKAIELYTACIEMKSETLALQSEFYIERARLYYKEGKSQMAIDDFMMANMMDPQNDYCYILLSFLERGNKERCKYYLELGIEKCKNDPYNTALSSLFTRMAWYYTHIDPDLSQAAKYIILKERVDKTVPRCC